jgi:hypothetical protein
MARVSCLLSVLLLASIVHLGACGPDLCPEARRVQADYQGECVAELVYESTLEKVTVSPRPQCPWERLIDIGFFNGFRPGMTSQEALGEIGPPDAERQDAAEEFWTYERPKAVIQIGHEDQGSGIVPFYYWWTLNAFPRDRTLEALFSPEVLARLPKQGSFREVFILNQCGLPMIVVTIDKGLVSSVSWTRNPGSYKAPNS